jgi:hypothetical protein
MVSLDHFLYNSIFGLNQKRFGKEMAIKIEVEKLQRAYFHRFTVEKPKTKDVSDTELTEIILDVLDTPQTKTIGYGPTYGESICNIKCSGLFTALGEFEVAKHDLWLKEVNTWILDEIGAKAKANRQKKSEL